MLKYKYVYCGDFFRQKLCDGKLYDDREYYNYQIEVRIPINYNTKEEASRCSCYLRFVIEDGHVVLKIYRDKKTIINKKGEYVEHVEIEVIDTVRWEEHWKYTTSRSRVVEKDMEMIKDGCDDYIPDATPWDDIFEPDKLPKGWYYIVESLAYGIDIVDVDE